MWLLHYQLEKPDRILEYVVLVPEEERPDAEEWSNAGYTLENCIEIEMENFTPFPVTLPVNVVLTKGQT